MCTSHSFLPSKSCVPKLFLSTCSLGMGHAKVSRNYYPTCVSVQRRGAFKFPRSPVVAITKSIYITYCSFQSFVWRLLENEPLWPQGVGWLDPCFRGCWPVSSNDSLLHNIASGIFNAGIPAYTVVRVGFLFTKNVFFFVCVQCYEDTVTASGRFVRLWMEGTQSRIANKKFEGLGTWRNTHHSKMFSDTESI